MPLYSLTPDQLLAYNNDGFCVVPDVLSVDERAAVYTILDEARALASTVNCPSSLVEDLTEWEQNPYFSGVWDVRRVPAPFERSDAFRSIFGGPAILDRVEQIIGSEIFLHSSKLIFKSPKFGRRKPMHQDLAYWDDMTAQQLTVWCSIDPATPENGCLEIVPGSHHGGLIPHLNLEDWQIDEKILKDRLVSVPMNAGDVLFLNVLTVHASHANQSDVGRLAAIVNYYSESRNPCQFSKYGSSTPLKTSNLK